MNKGKHLNPKDYDQIIAACMVEPDYNITEYLETQFSEHSPENANFMQCLEDAFDREERNSKYNNIKIAIAVNKGQVSDPRIDKLKIIAKWGELKKQIIELERDREILKRSKQNLSKIEKRLFEIENEPDFWNMFVVDPTPCEIRKGESFTSVFGIEKKHRFNIGNRQTVDESGVIIKDNYFRYYISELIILLSEQLKTSEISDFLNYHYQNANDKTGLINFISFDLWDYISESDIKPKRLNEINNWIEGVSHKQETSTKPEGIKCIEGINPVDLKFIFSKLMENGKLHKSVTETNFIATFQGGALPYGWMPLDWKGNNTELARLFYLLIGEKGKPALVNSLFIAKRYDSTQAKRGEKVNRFIDPLIIGAKK